MARSSLDRLAEEGPFNQRPACSSVGNTNDTGDNTLYFAVYKAKRPPPSAHTIFAATLWGRGY